jgi:hypothetical protein
VIRGARVQGLEKEANRIEESKGLGLAAATGRAKLYIEPDPSNGRATEVARRLGVTRRTVFNRRAWRAARRVLPSRAMSAIV